MAICPQGHASGSDDYCDLCGALISAPAPASQPGPAHQPSGPAAPHGTSQAASQGASESCPVCSTPRVGPFCELCGHSFADGSSTDGSSTDGSSTDGSSTDGSFADGSFADGSPASGSPVGGHLAGGSSAGGSIAGGSIAGGSIAGGASGMRTPVVGARWEAVAAADRAYYEQVIAQGGPDAAAMAFPPYCPERSFPLVGEQVRIGRSRRGRDLVPEIDLAGPPTDPGVSGLHAVLLASPGGSWMLVDPGSANGTQVNGRPVTVNVPVPVGAGDRIHLGAWTVITIREGTP
ncbi:FHA domain-containing protein [Nonomuraea sp. MCN248]|uniref:FHA domain-containing protein n=1 Tax=Nonomuraea corallina TaxID=2989783 RepID=A0ABT4SNN7_9ACTN|nr:FHA domain-containing protein [Nonomuraea corallina]MDA0638797.1 FHA domain-containing protein [Nonomuraea corallina]